LDRLNFPPQPDILQATFRFVEPNRGDMHWHIYVAHFFGAVFLANSIPHFVNGISGRAFQSPFAKPPGVGMSSSRINILWGWANLVLAYLLLVTAGALNLNVIADAAIFGLGLLLAGLLLAERFGRTNGGEVGR
jgi:hypothetical protein